LGIGDWAQSPIPNPQSPIPNPHLMFYHFNILIQKKFKKLNNEKINQKIKVR
jgi:hypothetical protein